MGTFYDLLISNEALKFQSWPIFIGTGLNFTEVLFSTARLSHFSDNLDNNKFEIIITITYSIQSMRMD